MTARKAVQVWNALHPPGTRVEYHPIIGGPEFGFYRTRGPAWIAASDDAVIALVAKAGYVALEACLAVPDVKVKP